MQAAYTLTRLMLFGFGWSIATVLALAADVMLPGVKWPILGLAAALWTLSTRCMWRGKRIETAPQVQRHLCRKASRKARHCGEPTGPAFGRPDDKLRDEAIQFSCGASGLLRRALSSGGALRRPVGSQ
jgi:hypothetical protein